MTYTALASLLILGDDLTRVNVEGDYSYIILTYLIMLIGVMKGLKCLQQSDGSFCSTADGTENDMRFVYCACSVCYILNDWSGLDKDKAVEFIKSSQVIMFMCYLILYNYIEL